MSPPKSNVEKTLDEERLPQGKKERSPREEVRIVTKKEHIHLRKWSTRNMSAMRAIGKAWSSAIGAAPRENRAWEIKKRKIAEIVAA